VNLELTLEPDAVDVRANGLRRRNQMLLTVPSSHAVVGGGQPRPEQLQPTGCVRIGRSGRRYGNSSRARRRTTALVSQTAVGIPDAIAAIKDHIGAT